MEQTKKRKFMLKEFKAISHAISTYEDIKPLLAHLTEGVSRAFSIMGASILLYDENSNQLHRVSDYGLSESYKGDKHIDANVNCKHCLGGVTVFNNVVDNECVNYSNEAAKAGINFILSIPVKFRKIPAGLLRLYHSESVTFHPDDINALEILTCQLGMAIELNGMENVIAGVKEALSALPTRLIIEN